MEESGHVQRVYTGGVGGTQHWKTLRPIEGGDKLDRETSRKLNLVLAKIRDISSPGVRGVAPGADPTQVPSFLRQMQWMEYTKNWPRDDISRIAYLPTAEEKERIEAFRGIRLAVHDAYNARSPLAKESSFELRQQMNNPTRYVKIAFLF